MKRRATLATVGALVLLSSACGTRLTTAQAQRQVLDVYGQGPAGVSSQGPGIPGNGGALPGGAPVPGASGTGGTGSQQGSGPSPSQGTSSANTENTANATTAPAPGSKAPILIGMNCDCSGVVGATFAPARDAYQAWVQMINAKGGIGGHPVKLLIADDNNSSTQDLQNVKTFVEQNHVIALVNLFAASGGIGPVARYAVQHHVPIVGGTGFDPEWTQFPVMFPTATSSNEGQYAVAAEMKAAGMKTLGSIYCAEADSCATGEAIWKKYAEQLGMKVAYENRASLAQPSFSADCLNARSNRVESILPGMDGASTLRIARDCDQQGYHPLIVNVQPSNDVPSYLNGSVASIGSFPWFLRSGSPALEEYGAAIAKYVRSTTNSYTALGWANAKLLEKALTGRVSVTPTSQDVFRGLWAMHGETLGGLTPPLNFHANANASPVNCAFRAVAKGGRWTAPDGVRPTNCMP